MRVLLTGARAPATLELARLCARAGHEVHVADTHRWHVCRGSRLIARSHQLPAPRNSHARFTRAVQTIVDSHAIDVIVPTCEEIFHLASIRDHLRAKVTCEPLDRLAPLHDKWRFVAACQAAGVKAPRTHLLTAENIAASLPVGAYILKPRYSRFATRVHRWHTSMSFPEHVDAASSQWIAQEQITGASLCTWSVAARGTVVAHATYAVDATAGPMGAAIAFRSLRHEGALAWVRRFVAHHRLTGQFAFDFIDDVPGVTAIECNPRLTSGVHCFRDQPDVVRALLNSDIAPLPGLLEPPAGQRFRSRLAMMMYGRSAGDGVGLLDANDDPWPRRLQLITWTHALVSSALHGTGPRRWSTHDIEWNGE